MKFSSKTKASGEIPTASMPDIIFMLLIFFMVKMNLDIQKGAGNYQNKKRKKGRAY